MEQLDPQVLALAKAIRQAESGGNFNARSKDGSYGAYQFIKPTWDATARKFGVNAAWEQATPQQQNEVAYKQLKEWKDKGYNVGQIASMWNAGAGRPNAFKESVKGVNALGVKYDVAGYAKKVATFYHAFKNGIDVPSPYVAQTEQVAEQPSGSRATFPITGNENMITAPLKALGNIPKSAFDFLKGIVTAPFTAVGNVIETGKQISQYSKETGENPASVFFNSLKNTPQSAYEVLTPTFIKHAINKDVESSLQSIVEDPIGQIAPILLLARGAAQKAGKGAQFDAAMSKIASPVTTGIPSAVGKVLPKGTPTPQKFQQAVGQVFQPKTPFESATAQKVAANVDFGTLPKNATYKQLSDFLQKNVDEKLAKVDENLGKYQESFKPLDLTKSVTSQGGKTIKINYVQEAINGLKNLYNATKDPQSLVKVKDLETKFKSSGLTSKEINNLAKEYGTEFKGKAFSKTGEPLTNTNAQAFENIRKGLKENARGVLPDDETRALDRNASSLIKAKEMSDRMAKKVDQLSNRIVQRRLGEKLGRTLGIALDWATLGTVRGFVARLFPSNVGLKTMNSLDLEANLGKNLKIIEKLVGAPDSTLIETLKNIAKKINNPQIPVGAGVKDNR